MNGKNGELGKDEILLVDKPAGMSSFGVVARVRRKLSEAVEHVEVKGKDGVVRRKRKKVKVGHTGTLDPFATGLLILLVGRGTKRAGEFLKLDKEYEAVVRLGEVSTTGDVEGEIHAFGYPSHTNQSYSGHDVASARRYGRSASPSSLVSSGGSRKDNLCAMGSPKQKLTSKGRDFDPVQPESKLIAVNTSEISSDMLCDPRLSVFPVVGDVPSREKVEEVVRGFVGEIEQRVPNYSAVKINGERAYKLARAGKEVEMPVRKVKIYELEILRYEWPELEIRCKVSSGTYIRTLGEDIGKALGVGGYLTSLRRTQVGKYRVEEAKKLEEIVE